MNNIQETYGGHGQTGKNFREKGMMANEAIGKDSKKLSEENIEKNELDKDIKEEQMEARKQFEELIYLVNRRYEKLPENMRKDYLIHNEEILDSAIELGIKKGFSPEELKILEMAAIWHDADKADAVPEKYKDVPQYALVVHGEKAADEIPDILTDGLLEESGFEKDDFEMVREEVANAIRQHMGPHPGFMDGMLKGANAKLRELGEKEIKHPKAQGKISEALLSADMRALAGTAGRKKVLSIRASVPFFKNQDKQLSEEYSGYDIKLSSCEAALLSGFDSAFQARDMIEDEKNREWVDEAIEDSMREEYESMDGNGDKMTWSEVSMKRADFESRKKDRLRETEIREKLAA